MDNVVPTHPNRRDAQQVEVLAGMGGTPEFIAKELGLSPTDLQAHYAKELEHGPQEANLRVAQAFHRMATSGEFPTMTLSWMKMRAGWVDNSPPPVESDDSSLDEAKEKLLKLLNRAHNSPTTNAG